VVIVLQRCRDIPKRDAISEDIVRSLQIEGLLDFRVWRNKEMQNDDGGEQEGERSIW